MSRSAPGKVRLVEVGARDGLQNETVVVPAEVKIALISRLVEAGLRHIEATAFVSPKWVPQMADHEAVMRGVPRRPGVVYSALTPNLKGFHAAVEAGAQEVAVFAAATEAFSHRNINCSIADSLKRFEAVLSAAREERIPVRGYVSCVLGCPYEGDVDPDAVAGVARALRQMGCHEISLGDTIGAGTPDQTRRMLEAVMRDVPAGQLAGHYHDTRGQALANIRASLELGIGVFDCSVAGLGGCPYAPGAAGNVATEDVVHLLQGMGIETGVDLDAVIRAGELITGHLGTTTRSRVALSGKAPRSRPLIEAGVSGRPGIDSSACH